MMMVQSEDPAPYLAAAQESRQPLAHTALVVSIVDLVAEYAVTHTFRNQGTSHMEAVFSFPVPLDAAFMGMQATLAGETLTAEIKLRNAASRD